jgi:Fic family protein
MFHSSVHDQQPSRLEQFTMASKYFEIDRRMESLRERFASQGQADLVREFIERLDFSWIYHDNALEGVVLSYHELKAAIDTNIISDASLIPAYLDIANHKSAIDFVRETAGRRRVGLGLEFLKKLYQVLSHDDSAPRNGKLKTPGQYRKDNPLHRLYFHEIAPPEKISYRVRKLVEWLATEEARKLHPIKRAAKAHFRLIGIYPWPKHSGKVARLLMNTILLREGYVPAIIHAIERQRYYEVLRAPHMGLTSLITESISGTIDAAHRFLDEELESVRAAS